MFVVGSGVLRTRLVLVWLFWFNVVEVVVCCVLFWGFGGLRFAVVLL